MDWQTRFFLIGLMVATFIGLWVLGRPLMPKIRRGVRRQWIELVFSVGLVIWGAGIWYLMISQNNYSNTLAMVMASALMVVGIYYLVRQILKKGK